jgi:hypothetical protein
MRTASPDNSYIDYTILKFGVRVRPASCRTIMRTAAGWEEYGEEIELPVDPRAFDPSGSPDLGDLGCNVAEYEGLASVYDREDGRELRELLLGIISLEAALRREREPRKPPA